MSHAASETKANPWPIAVAVILAAFMEVLDTSIANVSLGHIAGSLSVSTDESTWVLSTYLISNAIVIPTTAWFGQRFGRKRFLMTCLVIFTVASFLCGAATTLPMLLAMRIIQGAGGGALQPIAQSILLEAFPREKHGQAMGLYGLGVVIAPIVGPVLGGWITDSFTWRWIFFINVPVGIVVFLLINRFVHDPPWIRRNHPARLDLVGFSFMALWLGCQEVLFDKGQEDGWFGSHFIQLMAGLAVIGLAAFVVRMRAAPRPFVDLRVLKTFNFTLGLGLMFVAGLTLYGLTATIPLFLESLMGYTALQSGYAMIPRGLGALIAMPLAGRLVGKVSGRYLVAGGFLLFVASSLDLALISPELAPGGLFWALFLSGVSIGFIFVPLNTIALGGLKAEQLGNGSGIFNLMRNMGGSVGISLVTTFLARSAQAHQTALVAHLTPYDAAYTSRLQAMAANLAATGGDAVAARRQALGALYQSVVAQANLLAFLDNFRWFALVGAGCVAAAFLFRNVKASRPIPSH